MGPIGLLGIVQGLTEFLPVSSSGHLVLLQAWLKMPQEGAFLAIFLHLGTLAAIILAYPDELGNWMRGLYRGDRGSWQLAKCLVIATIPAALVGATLNQTIQGFFTPAGAALGWMVTTALLRATPSPAIGLRTLSDLSWREALGVGLMQALALWPGLSRSGSTIFGARRVGLRPDEATRFSFWLAIPITVGAVFFNLGEESGPPISGALLFGALLAMIAGYLAIRWLKNAVARSAYRHLAFYTLGLSVIALLTAMVGE